MLGSVNLRLAMQNNIIPTLEEEYNISKNYYKTKIFDQLPEDGKLKDVINKIFKMGNAPWFSKWSQYYNRHESRTSFAPQKTDPVHSSLHPIVASPQTSNGEPVNITMQWMSLLSAKDTRITEKTIRDIFAFTIKDVTDNFVSRQFNYTMGNAFDHQCDKPINSKENVQLCRVSFSAIFGLESFKEKTGKLPHDFNKNDYLQLPATYFKPHEIMFDTKLSFIDFNDNTGISPKNDLPYPKNDIKLIKRSCELVNRIASGEALKF